VSDDFKNVADSVLRHILRRDPKNLKTAYVRHAVDLTLNHLGRAVTDPTIPKIALAARIVAAAQARKAIDRRQRSKAHAAIRRYWSL
jgi:hypothetical protein